MTRSKKGDQSKKDEADGKESDNSSNSEPTALTKEDLLKLLDKQRAQFESALADLHMRIRPNRPDDDDGNAIAQNAATENRRRINVSTLEKLPADVSLRNYLTWMKKWDNNGKLEHMSSYPMDEQLAAFRLSLSDPMLQTVEKILGFKDDVDTTPGDIMEALKEHIRKIRNVALDRVELEVPSKPS